MRVIEQRGLVGAALIVLVAVLINAAVFAGRTYPTWRERVDAQRAYDQGESELHAVRQELRSLQVLGHGALLARDDLGEFLVERLHRTSSLPEAREHVRTSAEESGITVERVQYSVDSVDRLDAVYTGISVFGAGSYTALRRWIAELRKGPGFMFVDRVEIGVSGGSLLSIELTAVALLRVEEPVIP